MVFVDVLDHFLHFLVLDFGVDIGGVLLAVDDQGLLGFWVVELVGFGEL